MADIYQVHVLHGSFVIIIVTSLLSWGNPPPLPGQTPPPSVPTPNHGPDLIPDHVMRITHYLFLSDYFLRNEKLDMGQRFTKYHPKEPTDY